MKKLIQRIKTFLVRVFGHAHEDGYRRHVTVEDEKTLHEVVSAYDDISIRLANDIELTEQLNIVGADKDIKIDGCGFRIIAPTTNIGFGYPLRYNKTWRQADSAIEHADGTPVPFGETDKAVAGTHYRMKLSEAHEEENYICFTVGWTTYTFPVEKYEDGYVYFRGFTASYSPNFDCIRYARNPYYRLLLCPKEHPTAFAIKVRDGRLTLVDIDITGGITGNDAVLFIDRCLIHECLAQGLNLNGCNADISNTGFMETWRSAIKAVDGFLNVHECRFDSTAFSMSNEATIQTDGEYHISYNELTDFGSFGIRVGASKADKLKKLSANPTQQIAHNTLDNGTLSAVTDTGAIYVSPNNANCLIDTNEITNYRGLGNNHGIYLDDGAYNVTVSCNDIKVESGYAISARYVYVPTRGYAKEKTCTNRYIYGNVCCGGGIWYRSETDDNMYKDNTVLNVHNRDYADTDKECRS